MDVLCVGHACWDISAFVDGFPVENSKYEINSIEECGGGPAANAAWLIAKWGAACALAATVGSDSYADRVVEELARGGIDVSLVHRSPSDPTPVSVILVNIRTASRTIINRKAAVAASPCRIAEPPALGPVSDRVPTAPQVLLFDGHELEASLDATRHYAHARTILDAGSARPGTVELARPVDYLVASERFARQLSGAADIETRENQEAAMRCLNRRNGRAVVVTLGERGLLYGTGDKFEHIPAFAVASRDTTAAGDIFHGAFAFGVLRGMPIQETLRLAAAAAALSTTRRGGRSSVPSLAEVQEFLSNA